MYILTYNFYGWAIPQKLPLDGVGWVQNISQFKKYFIEKYKEDGDEGHFLEIDIYYPEKFYGFHNDLNYLPKRMKVERENLSPTCMIKRKCYTHTNFKTSIKLQISIKKCLESLTLIKKLG